MKRILVSVLLVCVLFLLLLMEQLIYFPSVLIAFFVGRIWWDVVDINKDAEIEIFSNKILALVEAKLLRDSVAADSDGKRGSITSIFDSNGKQE